MKTFLIGLTAGLFAGTAGFALTQIAPVLAQ